jgi:hypothetical protein
MTTFGHRLHLRASRERLAVSRLAASEPIPSWADGPGFVSITRTDDELSIVCAESRVPETITQARGLVAIRVEGTLAPELVGVLASIAMPLAEAGFPIVAIGTYDTDYVLVRAADVDSALKALSRAGHWVRGE